jgi:AAA domain-containing protein
MRHAVFQPVRLPDVVWSSADTRELLRERRVGQLFLLAKKHAGAGQARIAAATGLNQGEVSRIQRGDRWVTAIDVLERIADGLAMPDAARILLGLAPATWVEHTAQVVPAQLPPVVPGFVGRAAELAWLKEQRDAGCVLVTGPGGMGKTALVVAWAHRVDFPDGQLYVDMRDVDPADALAGFLRALGAPVPPTLPERTAQFRSALAGKQMLVIIDDAPGAEQVRPLLAGGGCLVVVTSRDPLDDLVVREGTTPLRLGPLPADEALDLVVRVAGRRQVEADPAAANELAEQAGRVPLALRAAAVRLGDQEEPPRTRWPLLLGVFGPCALAAAAGIAGLSDVVDRATLHAVVATRGGQLAMLGLLVLAGCGVLLAPIARLARRRPPMAAGCLLGLGMTTVLTAVGRTPSGPPPLVDIVHLVSAGVWAAILAVAAITIKRLAGYAIGIPVAAVGTWFVVTRLLEHGTATNHTYGHLLISGSTLVFAALGVWIGRPRRPERHGSRRVTGPIVAAVVVLLATSSLAAIPGPRARHRAYDSVVYARHIESAVASSHTGREPIRLTAEAGCDTNPCSWSPV